MDQRYSFTSADFQKLTEEQQTAVLAAVCFAAWEDGQTTTEEMKKVDELQARYPWSFGKMDAFVAKIKEVAQMSKSFQGQPGALQAYFHKHLSTQELKEKSFALVVEMLYADKTLNEKEQKGLPGYGILLGVDQGQALGIINALVAPSATENPSYKLTADDVKKLNDDQSLAILEAVMMISRCDGRMNQPEQDKINAVFQGLPWVWGNNDHVLLEKQKAAIEKIQKWGGDPAKVEAYMATLKDRIPAGIREKVLATLASVITVDQEITEAERGILLFYGIPLGFNLWQIASILSASGKAVAVQSETEKLTVVQGEEVIKKLLSSKYGLTKDDFAGLNEDQNLAFMELIKLMSRSDNQLTSAERGAIGILFSTLPWVWGNNDHVLLEKVKVADLRIDEAFKSAENLRAFARSVKERLPSVALQEKALAMVMALATCDQTFAGIELGIFGILGDTWGIPLETVKAISLSVREIVGREVKVTK